MNSIKISSLLFLIVFDFTFSNAQLRIEKASGELFEDGEVFTFDEVGVFGTNIGKLPFFLYNESETEDVTAKIEIQEIRGADGSGFVFCVQPLCIFEVSEGLSYPGDGAVISPESYNSMDDYFINTDEGDENTTTIEYDLRFYTIDSDGSESDVLTITYVYDSTFSNLEFDLPQLGIDIHNTQVLSNLKLDSNDNFNLQVFNLSGKKVISTRINKGYHQIDMNSLAKGIYIARFENQRGSSQIKLLKE